MTTLTNTARQAAHDNLELRVKAAEARLDNLKARAEIAKDKVEIKALADLAPQGSVLRQLINQAKRSEEDYWQGAKADLESGIADLEQSLKEIEARAKED
jgi:hypothetical protein